MKQLSEILPSILGKNSIIECALEHKKLYDNWNAIVEEAFTKNKSIQKNDIYISDTYISKEYRDLIDARKAADHSAVKYIKNGTIFVEADHQGWMQILQTQQNRILKIAAAKFPDLKIKSIAFVLANSDGTSRIPYKQDEQGRQDENAGTGCTNTIEQDNPAEITENSENQAQSLQENVEDVLAAIKNEELRDLLRQLEKKIRKS